MRSSNPNVRLRNFGSAESCTVTQVGYFIFFRPWALLPTPPMDMSSQLPVTQQNILAKTYRKTLKPLFQSLLKIGFHPAVVSLALFYVLYSVAEYTFTDWYFAVGHVWKPAFPLSWRIVLLSLFVVPALASIQLVWLALQGWALGYHWWRCLSNARSSPSQGYMMLSRSESSSLVEGVGEDDYAFAFAGVERDTPCSRISCPPKQASRFVWPLQFVFWLAVLCASLWVALHYRHAGDLRYLPLIERANAHPKREGYANNGNVTSAGPCVFVIASHELICM